jgi:hypothetical protein
MEANKTVKIGLKIFGGMSMLGGVINFLEHITNIRPQILGQIFSYNVPFPFPLWILVVLFLFFLLFLWYYLNTKSKLKKYENYEATYFPGKATAPFLRINVKDSEIYKLDAFCDKLCENLPVYDISRKGNIIVAYITKPYKYDEIVKKIKVLKNKVNYVDFNFMFVDGGFVDGVSFNKDAIRQMSEIEFIQKFSHILWNDMPEIEKKCKLAEVYELLKNT